MNKAWQDVPIPARMAGLERDKRGFPVPFIVARDKAGEPLFTINDSRLTEQCIAESRCGICGGELEYGDLWWVGGPMSAFHPQGVYIDGPMHLECSTYALRVCPHLAAPKYTKRIDGLPAMKNGTDFEVFKDHTVMPDRPLVFVQGQSISYDVTWPLTPDRKLIPRSGMDLAPDGEVKERRWLHYEVWQHGALLGESEGLALIKQAFAELKDQRTQAPKIMMPEKPEIII